MTTMKNAKGVDISYANGDIDLKKVKAAGFDFVMIRCGYGSDYAEQDDWQFLNNVRKAEAIGMPWGAYLYSYALNESEARSELAHILRLLKGKKPTMPIAIDVEDSDNYRKNHGGWTYSNVDKCTRIVLEGLKAAGYYPMLYTGFEEINGLLSKAVYTGYDMWFAHWASKCGYSGSNLSIWQYGGETNLLESNSIPGVGTIDKDRCYKDYPTIIKSGGFNNWSKSSSTTAQPSTTKASIYTAARVVELALAEVGYMEKASNSQLDSKTANAGHNNWTKYAAYIDNNCPDFYNGKKNGFDWCDIFNDYIHVKAADDAEEARKGLYQPKRSTGAGCPYSAQFYRDNNAWTDRGAGVPKPGDQIFFGPKGDEYHTGIVVKVSGSIVYTVEGNSSDMVAERQYSTTDTRITGYGRPKYSGSSSSSSSGSSSSGSSAKAPDVIYKVRAGGKWLPEVKNLEDYAGIVGKAITDVAIKVTKGSIKYRVHVKGGGWLSWITKYDTSDIMGYAGIGSPIDAIEIYYYTPSDIAKAQGYYKAKYRVSPVKSSYYSYQYDNEKTNGQDGYAGYFGKTIDRLQITLSK